MDNINVDHRSVLDDKVSPKAMTSSKRKITHVTKTKINRVSKKLRHRNKAKDLCSEDHPSWTEVVRKGKWNVKEAQPVRLKQ